VCAQLQAYLQRFIPVGCDTPIPDDWETWLPRARWEQADALLLITDNRFEVDAHDRFPERVVTKDRVVEVKRGSRVVRAFRVRVLRRESALELSPGTPRSGEEQKEPSSPIRHLR
jgi:hypothetical protein